VTLKRLSTVSIMIFFSINWKYMVLQAQLENYFRNF
jgi:hypothetical protein